MTEYIVLLCDTNERLLSVLVWQGEGTYRVVITKMRTSRDVNLAVGFAAGGALVHCGTNAGQLS